MERAFVQLVLLIAVGASVSVRAQSLDADAAPTDVAPGATDVTVTPADGAPVDGAAVDGAPADVTPADVTPADAAPADGARRAADVGVAPDVTVTPTDVAPADAAIESASTTRSLARPRVIDSETPTTPRVESPAHVALPDRLPFLAAGWRPIATAGYRLQIGRQPFDHVDVVDVRAAHGFTAGLLFPLIASGTASSRTRLAFALGVGADFAVARYAATYPYRSDDGLRYQVPAYGERTTYLYGQVAAVLRTQLGARVALTTSLAWLPGARLVRIGGEDVPRRRPGTFFAGLPPVLVSREWARSFERARLQVGVQVGALHAGVFFGATSRDGLFFGRRQELDLGAQLGAGW